MDLTEELRNLPSKGPEAAAELVGRALETASDESGALDRAVVHALWDCVSPDPILERLEPGHLGRLLERCTRRVLEGGDFRELTHSVLDLSRRSSVLRRIEQDQIEGWANRFLEAIEGSNLTLGMLFRQRAELYGSKPLFIVPQGKQHRTVSWRQAAVRVERIARGLIALDPGGDATPIAILSENRIEMALTDLACLTTGMVNAMVAASSTEDDVGFILRHIKARTAIVSNQRQLEKVMKVRESAPELRHIVIIDPRGRRAGGVLSLDEVIAGAESVPPSEIVERTERVGIDDLASVMYTSGTTGMPKAIQFTQRNLVFKRFARALALPEIGEEDTFLCFLPLFHTFGRYLEMLGCVFWGATYCFLENPSMEALVEGMRLHHPTVFISVPKRWIQLHEAITRRADPVRASDEELLAATRQITGGRLRWGLSAAGHLDSDIFRFFQRQGIELLSGFGMTEATGGITMTPPGGYKDDSLGPALPGIELRLEEDGELQVRGPYVMSGYLDPPKGEDAVDEEGWLSTGDLMEVDGDGFLRLIDRKKEIYKNIKGETVAPQRVENFFRDFESVGRVFLVGDHREYNILLIHPNPEYREVDLGSLPEVELREHFRSLVVSVNKFLAPFERIVDFAVIDRDLDPDRGELTPKGTPRRQVVARNFAEIIRQHYRTTVMEVGGAELKLPNWLFQETGLTAQDIEIDDGRLVLSSSGAALAVRKLERNRVLIGSCIYEHPHGPLDIGAMLSAPRLWLGNDGLVDFLPLELEARKTRARGEAGWRWIGRITPFEPIPSAAAALHRALERPEHDLLDLDLAARFLAATDEKLAMQAVKLLEMIVPGANESLAEPARLVLSRAARAERKAVRRHAFEVLVPAERASRFEQMLRSFLEQQPHLLDSKTREALCNQNLSEERIDGFMALADRACTVEEAEEHIERLAFNLLRFLAAYGAAHPASYRRVRAFLVRMSLFARHTGIRATAAEAAASMEKAFRRWLGTSTKLAVDPETGLEYRWSDVIVFDDGVEADDRGRLLAAITQTAMLKEAVFHFSKGLIVRLSNIPPGGVWIRPIGARHGKAVYRVTIQTRHQGSYEVAINVNHSLKPEQLQEEINWLILSGDPGGANLLAEEFGGYWEEQDLWSEEFISGETLDRAMLRLSKRSSEQDRFQQLWPFLAWTTLCAYVGFWARSGKLFEIADPSVSGVVVPTVDYHTGFRLVSVAARRLHRNLIEMMRSFMGEVLEPAVEQYPQLEGVVGWDVVFSSILEVLGEQEGLPLLARELDRHEGGGDDPLLQALARYIETVRVRGFIPRRLFFAIKRYRRWEELSAEATRQARARTLQELYDTYGLQQLADDHPESRLRMFRETVLSSCTPALGDGLEELIARMRRGELTADELVDTVADLRSGLELGPDEDYFLARIPFRHLRPEDAAGFEIGREGRGHQSEIVVRIEDHEGNLLRIRHALNPKEVGKLHRLFLASKLDVRFRPEHRYLVAINDRSQLVGGLYYETEEDGQIAHLEKIVVSEPYRRKGVADGLMKELFNRLRAAGAKTVTTGFFRPQYFYGYGFSIEKRYAGLVKNLEVEG
jgi:long-subunit acyl-CoA synthetase (AMP-forming)/GNAT superfamily N-acetyltransferase